MSVAVIDKMALLYLVYLIHVNLAVDVVLVAILSKNDSCIKSNSLPLSGVRLYPSTIDDAFSSIELNEMSFCRSSLEQIHRVVDMLTWPVKEGKRKRKTIFSMHYKASYSTTSLLPHDVT